MSLEEAIFHPDPDVLVAYEMGMHEYKSIDEAKQAYVSGDLSRYALEAVLEDLLA